jgi:hypothetical protein
MAVENPKGERKKKLTFGWQVVGKAAAAASTHGGRGGSKLFTIV